MHMRMMRQIRTPGVQHQRRPDPCAQMLGVSGESAQRFRCNFKQQAIDGRLVGVSDGADRLELIMPLNLGILHADSRAKYAVVFMSL